MSPEFLIPETTVREAGAGPEISLDEQQGSALIVTLGIMRIIEQESLDLSSGDRRTVGLGRQATGVVSAEVLLRYVPDDDRPSRSIRR